MKKIFLLLFMFLVCAFQVNADDSYFLWHNSIDNAYTTNYDGMISNQVGKYQNNTIESMGNKKVKLNNFNAYDVMLLEETTWEIKGNNTISFIEESSNSTINLTGNGKLKFKSIGLSMSDMLNTKTENLNERIKTYLKGKYTLSIENDFIVITMNNSSTTTTTTTTTTVITDSGKKEKTLSLENKEFNVKIESPSKVPAETLFIVENKIDALKDEINSKLDNEEVKYVYDFKLQDGKNMIEPSEEVQVSIKLTSLDYIVYFYNENKELEKIESKYENGFLVFKTNHFSEYVITSPKEINKDKQAEKEINNNNNNNILLVCGSIIIVVIIAVAIVIIRKRK